MRSVRTWAPLFALGLAAGGLSTAQSRSDLEVTVRNGDVVLAGTLSLPAGGVGRFPVAVLISGDGPQDRDGGPGGAGLPRLISEQLAAVGVAALRLDDRNAGGSTTTPGPPSYRALLEDTRAAIAFVRARAELDPRRVALIGHSEGAKTAEVLAAEVAQIAAIVLMAGATAVNVDSLLIEQARATPDGPAPRLLPLVATARAGARASGPGDLTDWIREHLEIAPRDVLTRVRCPVLIVQGDRDHLVPPHHAAEAAAVLRAGGNRRVTVRTFPGLSHVFNRWAPGSDDTPVSRPVDPAVPRQVASWLRTTLGVGAQRKGS